MFDFQVSCSGKNYRTIAGKLLSTLSLVCRAYGILNSDGSIILRASRDGCSKLSLHQRSSCYSNYNPRLSQPITLGRTFGQKTIQRRASRFEINVVLDSRSFYLREDRPNDTARLSGLIKRTLRRYHNHLANWIYFARAAKLSALIASSFTILLSP